MKSALLGFFVAAIAVANTGCMAGDGSRQDADQNVDNVADQNADPSSDQAADPNGDQNTNQPSENGAEEGQKALCDAAAIKASCGMDIPCGASCAIATGDSCHAECKRQDAEKSCIKLCGMEDCNDYECYKDQCMMNCQPEYWYGCDYHCDQGDALFCDGQYIPFMTDKAACYKELDSASMLYSDSPIR